MNIYEKLSKARLELQGLNLKKSGQRNRIQYYELSDILPSINAVCDRHKLLPLVSFDRERATLALLDAEKPEDVVTFTSPFGSANLAGCHEVQNIGAVETYQRRYLYMTAFEIVESDWVDGSFGEEPQKAAKPAEGARTEYRCEKCGAVIQAVKRKDGSVMSAEEIYRRWQMCPSCVKEEMSGRE